jgi:hypothetical protein
MRGGGVGLIVAVVADGVRVTSDMVPGVDGKSERNGSRRRRLMFLSPREDASGSGVGQLFLLVGDV